MSNLQKKENETESKENRSIPAKNECPVCGSLESRALGRGLCRCAGCRSVFNRAYSLREYGDSYFLDEYNKQYGKTYIDDYFHISNISRIRLKKIMNIMGGPVEMSRLRLLDIGSAAGFFLKSASDYGIGDVKGVEISKFASEYCRREFGLDVINASFGDIQLSGGYDIVTAWYFIEHTPHPAYIVEKIYHLLKKGGIMAISVPSVFGPLFYFDRSRWVESHPEDHRIDFHPAAAVSLLKKTGFMKVVVKPAGYHPERVFNRDSFLFPLFDRVYKPISRILKFSDTLEIFAVK